MILIAWTSQNAIWSFQLDADTLGQEYPCSYQPKAHVKYVDADFKQTYKRCKYVYIHTGMLSELSR